MPPPRRSPLRQVVAGQRDLERHDVPELPDDRAGGPQPPVGGVAEREDPQKREGREGRRDPHGDRDGGVERGEEERR